MRLLSLEKKSVWQSIGRESFSTLTRWLDRLQPSGSLVLGGAAVVVGLLGGAGIWGFKQLIDLAHHAMFDGLGRFLGSMGAWAVALLPPLAGLAVGLILYFLVGVERRHGVSGIMEAVALAGGRLRYWRMPPKALAAALSIGGGASVGPEDPSVQIGASFGSMIGQWLRMSDSRVRALVAAGVAAGIAAAFNAPIAGVFFALEIVLGEIGGGALGVVVLASVVSAAFTQAVSGAQPAFHVPIYTLHSVWELPFYIGLGLLAGPISALYARTLYFMHDLFRDLEIPRWLKPAVGGLAVGLVGIFLPQLFGVGYETIEGVLGGKEYEVGLLLLLLVGKLILTPVSVGSGFPGGVFAPSLFLGATLGALYAVGVEALFPDLGISVQAFAMVGMAAILAGAVHAPLTAILLLFEMTNDYRIILPLMFAVTVSLYISQRLQRESIYTMALARKGVHIEYGRDVEVLEAITVGEVMNTSTPTLRETDSLEAAGEMLMRLRRHGLPVVGDDDELVGILTVQDVDRNAQGETAGLTVGDVCTRELLTAYPDETLGTAMRRMGVRDVGRLPVVARENPRELLGVLRRSDLVRAYDTALARRVARRHRAHQTRLDTMPDITVEEIVVGDGAPCVGQRVRDVVWPQGSVIATVRRGREVIIPRGDTMLEAGDVLAVVAEDGVYEAIRLLCARAV